MVSPTLVRLVRDFSSVSFFKYEELAQLQLSA